MKFRNYCIVVMDNTKGVSVEIRKISESKPNILDAKGIVIATFTSAVSINELHEWFRLNNRSFFIFDLDPSNSSVHLERENLHNFLFGFLNSSNDNILRKRANEFLNAIQDAEIIEEDQNKKPNQRVKQKDKRITEFEIKNMTPSEKTELIDKLIDNGVENLTEYDKKLLSLLAK